MILHNAVLCAIIICVFIGIYPYLFYPFVLTLLAKSKTIKTKKDFQFMPGISIIISAYNEEDLIAKTIEKIIESDYPSSKYEILIGDDGSNDNTLQIINELAAKHSNLKIFPFGRSGKNSVVTQLVNNAKNEYLCFIDADILIEKNTLKLLASNFADPTIGVSLARLNFDKAQNINSKGDSAYRKYENYLQEKESEIFSTVNAFGGCYMMKKSNYYPIPSDQIADDFYPILTTQKSGLRVIIEKEAFVSEDRAKSIEKEFARKARFASAGMATVWEMRSVFSFKRIYTSFFLFSHKILRWASPFILLKIAALTFALDIYSLAFKIMLVSQVVCYTLAVIGYAFDRAGYRIKILNLFLFFITINISFLFGFVSFLKRKVNSSWEK